MVVRNSLLAWIQLRAHVMFQTSNLFGCGSCQRKHIYVPSKLLPSGLWPPRLQPVTYSENLLQAIELQKPTNLW
jgi:hypothetical protein